MRRLTPIGFLALRHVRSWESTRPGFASPCMFRFQGLVTLLAAYASQASGPLFQAQAPLGFPLQSLFPFEEPYLFRGLLLSCPWVPPAAIARPAAPGLQSLVPFKELVSQVCCYANPGPITLLGFSSLGFPPPTLRPLSSLLLFRAF
jgi:hypothetical protein